MYSTIAPKTKLFLVLILNFSVFERWSLKNLAEMVWFFKTSVNRTKPVSFLRNTTNMMQNWFGTGFISQKYNKYRR